MSLKTTLRAVGKGAVWGTPAWDLIRMRDAGLVSQESTVAPYQTWKLTAAGQALADQPDEPEIAA
jgi:hypothetical protein